MIEADLAESELALSGRIAPDGLLVFELGGEGEGGAAPGAEAAAPLRGAVLHGTRAIARMRANHRLSDGDVVSLGRAYLCAGLVSASLKGGDAFAFRTDGGDPGRGVSVEARAGGLVRGRLLAPAAVASERGGGPASAGTPPEPARGVLTVSRNAFDGAAPWVGAVPFRGGVDEALSAYYRESEQTPSAFGTAVLAAGGAVAGAGAWYLQVLPGAGPEALEEAARAARAAPDPARWFSEGRDAEGWLAKAFRGLRPRLLGWRPFSFACDCSRGRIASFLGNLDLDSLVRIAEDGPFPLVASCPSCGSEYEYAEAEVRGILARRLEGRARESGAGDGA